MLIEEWLPIKELGIESVRERAAASALPPLSFLHIWWARRPLAASAGTILCSLLPAWSRELEKAFSDEPRLGDERQYRQWVLRLCGVWGDPVKAKAALDAANLLGIKLQGNGYGYSQAYKNCPSPADLGLLHRVLVWTWGRLPSLIDPTAGGGSIPYSGARYGIPSLGNDLNGVAAVTLRAGVETTAEFGTRLTPDLEKWGQVLVERCRERLEPFFQLDDPSERVIAYIYARTVACPRTGKQAPLSPNWWLSKSNGLAKSKWVAVQPIIERDGVELDEVDFEIIKGQAAIDSTPDDGTQSRGNGISVWDRLPIDGDYIKAEAQAGRMGSVLYSVANRTKAPGSGKTQRGYRMPTDLDRAAITAADAELEKRLPAWLSAGIVPDEEVPDGNDNRPKNYGMTHWRDLFSSRQVLVHGTFVEEWQRLRPEIESSLGTELGQTVCALLGLMQGKALNWNALMSSWDASRTKVRSVFDRHDLAFKWTYAEFEGARELYPWCLTQLVEAFRGIAELYEPGRTGTVLQGGQYVDPGARKDLLVPV
ncbi:DUF1156 domain-containing protein, partial [Ilumatobacter sp.]|uniref:DUF1156 domain-containing protein n=1 Tax=Ilumatobacter sp. TaxID=1967498 RepID=UPI003753AB42